MLSVRIHGLAQTIAVLLLATGVVAPAGASAEVVCSGQRNLDVPQDGEGLYINFVTGLTGTAESQVPGFDFDPYAQQTSNPAHQLRFYWGSASNNGAGVASTGDTYAVLAPGAIIGPDSLFTRAGAAGNTSAWQAGVSGGYLGTRFANEIAGVLTYGWVRLDSTPPLGFPLTVLDWCYEDSGDAITIPIPVVDEIFCDGFDGIECTAVPTE